MAYIVAAVGLQVMFAALCVTACNALCQRAYRVHGNGYRDVVAVAYAAEYTVGGLLGGVYVLAAC